jgi:hypothetical protein
MGYIRDRDCVLLSPIVTRSTSSQSIMPSPPWFRDVGVSGRRRRRSEAQVILPGDEFQDGSDHDDPSSGQLRVMAIHHSTALVLIFYALYALCRFGFGWDPARDPPPPTYTVHIKGLTDDTAAVSMGTLTWNLRGSYSKENYS